MASRSRDLHGAMLHNVSSFWCRAHIPDFIIPIFDPPIICFIAMLHPRVPSLAIAALGIARCLFISHLCGPSGMPDIMVVIFDRTPEHDMMCAEAALNVTTSARMAAGNAAYFIVSSFSTPPAQRPCEASELISVQASLGRRLAT